jgi:hypothetical protein
MDRRKQFAASVYRSLFHWKATLPFLTLGMRKVGERRGEEGGEVAFCGGRSSDIFFSTFLYGRKKKVFGSDEKERTGSYE